MTKTVLDNALLLESIAGNDNIDDRCFAAPWPSDTPRYSSILKDVNDPRSLRGLKVGILKEALDLEFMDPRVKECFYTAVEGFREAGATVSEVSIPLHKKAFAIWTGVARVGGYLKTLYGAPGRRGHAMHELNGLFPEALRSKDQWDKAYVASQNIFLHGAWAVQQYPALLAKVTNLSRQLRDAYDAALKEYDVLVTPTLPYVATHHPDPALLPSAKLKRQEGLTLNTCPFNQSGHPALTLPIGMLPPLEGPAAGKKDVKLPVGLQIVGKWWDEATVYRVAYAWELNHDWKKM